MAENDGYLLDPGPEIPADHELDAAEESALLDPFAAEDDEEPAPRPFGRSWRLDPERGRLHRQGAAPEPVEGLDALRTWCEVVAHTARGAHAIFEPDVGVSRPSGPVGTLDAREAASDLIVDLRRALLTHDRIVAVEDGPVTVDVDARSATLDFVVVTDAENTDEERLPMRTTTDMGRGT